MRICRRLVAASAAGRPGWGGTPGCAMWRVASGGGRLPRRAAPPNSTQPAVRLPVRGRARAWLREREGRSSASTAVCSRSGHHGKSPRCPYRAKRNLFGSEPEPEPSWGALTERAEGSSAAGTEAENSISGRTFRSLKTTRAELRQRPRALAHLNMAGCPAAPTEQNGGSSARRRWSRLGRTERRSKQIITFELVCSCARCRCLLDPLHAEAADPPEGG